MDIDGNARRGGAHEDGLAVGVGTEVAHDQVLVTGQDVEQEDKLHGWGGGGIDTQGGAVDARTRVPGNDGLVRAPGGWPAVPPNVQGGGVGQVPDQAVPLERGRELGVCVGAKKVVHLGVVGPRGMDQGVRVGLVLADQRGEGGRRGPGDEEGEAQEAQELPRHGLCGGRARGHWGRWCGLVETLGRVA
jgi:hypothetical protein